METKIIAQTTLGKALAVMNNNHSDSINHLIRDGYQVESSIYLSRGFNLLKQNFKPLLGYGIFCIAIQVGFEQLVGITEYSNIPTRIVNINLVGPLYAGFFYFLFQKLKGESANIKTFFAGFKRNRLFALIASFLFPFLLSFIGGYSFVWLGDSLQLFGLYVVGALLLIFPGIYLSVAYTFALPLVVERRFNFWRAMETSRQIVTCRWWGIFGFYIGFSLLMCLVSLPVLVFWFMLTSFYAFSQQTEAYSLFESTFIQVMEFIVNGGLSGLISLWWICSIAVAYERIIGFRDV